MVFEAWSWGGGGKEGGLKYHLKSAKQNLEQRHILYDCYIH